MWVGTGVRQSGAAPQGQPGGAESQILATQSGASSQPSPGASSHRPPPALTSPTQSCPRAPEPLSQHPFQPLQVFPDHPPHLIFRPAKQPLCLQPLQIQAKHVTPLHSQHPEPKTSTTVSTEPQPLSKALDELWDQQDKGP